MTSPPRQVEILGTTKIEWRENESDRSRSTEILASHCDRCIRELRRLHPTWRFIDSRKKNEANR